TCGLPGPTLVISTPSWGMSNAEPGVGAECPPPPMIMCTVPSEVSISDVSLLCGAGVSRLLPDSTPRTGNERSKWCSCPATTRSTPYWSNSGSQFCLIPRSAPLKCAEDMATWCMHTTIQSMSSELLAAASSPSSQARCAPELYPLMYGLSPLDTWVGTWSRRNPLNPPSCRQTSSLLSEITRIDPTVNAYQLPRKSPEPLSGSSNLVW